MPQIAGVMATNLCFHGIGAPVRPLEPGEDTYWITRDAYERILDEVAERPEVRLSFDDGNWSDVEYALPGLTERGLEATFFVLAGRLGAAGSLDEEAVRLLHESGMRIGSHGMDHRSWRGMDEPTARRELVEARSRIAAVVGAPVTDAALPRGQYDRTTLARLRRLGYRAVFTSDRTRAPEGAWLQPRFSVVCSDTAESVREQILGGQSLARRLERAGVTLVKRLR